MPKLWGRNRVGQNCGREEYTGRPQENNSRYRRGEYDYRPGIALRYVPGCREVEEEKWLKPRLIEEVESKRDKKTMAEIFAENAGHRVLFLPVHHPELNPIELVWNTAKGYCARLFSNETSFQRSTNTLGRSL